MKRLIKQICKFGIIGLICSLIDYFGMILLTEVFQVYYLLSSCISFSVSLVFNYIWSMKYVFEGKEELSKKREFLIFLILSLLGLGINQLTMWLLVSVFNVFYMLAKILATGIVMVWNFMTRKIFLEKNR